MERRFIYGNCMSYLPDFPDNYFDVAVVDPPYFSGPEKRKFYGKCMKLQPKDLKNFGHRLVFLILSAITEAKSASARAFPGRG